MSERSASNLVSVIMPCYNAAPYLDEAVSAVMNQSHPNVELIVIDDGSNDGSLEILQRRVAVDPGRIKLLFQRRGGPYPARNLGLQNADGSFVAFLDADDWWSTDCTEKLHSALAQSRVCPPSPPGSPALRKRSPNTSPGILWTSSRAPALRMRWRNFWRARSRSILNVAGNSQGAISGQKSSTQ